MPVPGWLRPLRPLLVRATVLYLVGRLLLTVFSAVSVAQGGPPADHLIGILLLAPALGLVDVHRRGERMLWANLGYSMVLVGGIFLGVAIVGEIAVRNLP